MLSVGSWNFKCIFKFLPPLSFSRSSLSLTVNCRPQRSLSPDLANRQAAALLQLHAHRAGSVHPHLGAVSHQKEEEQITDLKIVKNRPEETDLKTENKVKSIVVCVFLFVAGHYRQGKEGGRKLFQIHTFFRLFLQRRVSGSGAWKRRTATVPVPKNLPQHCSSRFQKALDFLGFIL